MKLYKILFASILSIMITTGNAQSKVTGKEVTYTISDKTFKGYVAYDASKKGKRPGILVVPEWWGCNDYVRMRARKLAALGYIAFAVDMYGDGKLAANPQEAQQLAGEIYGNMEALKSRMLAAEEKLKSYSQTDPGKIGAIGYCFGGFVALNAAKMGMDYKGTVSFHGGLGGVAPDKNLVQSKFLVCHGGADKFVSAEEVNKFKAQMDSAGVAYTFKVYPGASHAYSNPASTATGKKFNLPIAYNEAADKNSWNDMKAFFTKIFKK